MHKLLGDTDYNTAARRSCAVSSTATTCRSTSRAMLATFMTSVLATSSHNCDTFTADIHMPLLGDALGAAVAANKQLQIDNAIDFATEDTPHITLYLTEWQCAEEDLATRLHDELYELAAERCHVTLGSPYASGSFAMLNVSVSACVQRYSDGVVNATYQLAAPNQSVPSWVYSLPEPERSEKIDDVHRYGSPNVLDQFQAHVTIGWASNATAVAAAVAALDFEPGASFEAVVVAIGTAGAHGTVLAGRDLARYNLTVPGDACRAAHADEPSCDADHVTSGGCVWCDIVDEPAFCSTRENARNLPRFPPHQCNLERDSPRPQRVVERGDGRAERSVEPVR